MTIATRATEEDISSIVGLVGEFVREAQYGWQFDWHRANSTISGLVNYRGEDLALLVVRGQGRPIGFAIVGWDQEFTSERIAYLMKFYVEPGARGTQAARGLRDACLGWWAGHGCKAAFATATARIGEDQLFVNLWAKRGWVPCGPTLMGKVGNGEV